MRDEKIIPKKSLGQNFLKDKEVLKKIIKAAELKETDNVLEIGPGKGVLTSAIVGKINKIITIEKDKILADNIARNFQFPISNFQSISNELIYNFQNRSGVISGDVLKINLAKLIEANNFQDYKIVANIPYYITGKFLRIILEGKYLPEIMVLMLQKEVAERICARKGSMNKPALLVKYFGEAEIISEVPREAFEPVPKVDSAILKIKINNFKADRNFFKKIFQMIRIGFSSPRKMLINNLANGLEVDKKFLIKIFKQLDISLNSRAENFDLKDWEKLTLTIKNNL